MKKFHRYFIKESVKVVATSYLYPVVFLNNGMTSKSDPEIEILPFEPHVLLKSISIVTDGHR